MTTYTLRRAPHADARPPQLDTSQQAVVAHDSGPLLVLAGPGTGKTTTMVEAIVDLVEHRGVGPEEILALTFSRKAAEQLRDRVTARLGRTLGTPLAATFHSFAYSLVRELAPKDAYAAPLRLLSAPQQDVVLRDLLRPSPESVPWPGTLSEAVGTRGFSREVQLLLNRARERGLTGDQLVAIGSAVGRPEWEAAGQFLEQYLTILDDQSSLDYADLVARAVLLAQRPRVQSSLRQRYRWVFVDEYQDTDPGQVGLLHALAGDGRNLVVVGDPDQSIYGFRGAEVRGILDFPTEFRTAKGAAAPVVALQTTRRFGPALLSASRRIATSIPTAGSIPGEAFTAFREPVPVEGEHGSGELEVLYADTARAEVEHIADRLRRAHLEDGVGWSDMAVLVRSGRTSIPILRRALSAAGVPVEVSSDDTPLIGEPAVAPLVDGLRVVVHLDNHDPQHPDHVDDERAASLLASPLGGLDAAEIRAVARALHHRERAAAAREGRPALPSPSLLRRAVTEAEFLDGLPSGRGLDKARRLARLLADTRRQLDQQASAEELLWILWSRTRWPERLRATATSGTSGAAAAHRDLDAICALFEEAAKTEEQRGHTSPQTFLETLAAQVIPADTLADRGVRGEAVRLLTAHRSKGLEWRLVVVASVQEGSWPDLRRRSTLLGADELPSTGSGDAVLDPLPPVETRALLAEERRLFYVACTRARQRLIVTAVASPDDDGDQPSRFTEELGVVPVKVIGRPERPLSLAGVVAELRRTVADPDTPAGLRDAAVRRLARLARERHRDLQLVASADPSTWWGTRSRSVSSHPLRTSDEPVRISASTLEAVLACPAKWFLEHEAGGTAESTAAQGFGKIVHGLADRVARGDLGDQVTEDTLMAHVDTVWSQLHFRTPWSAVRDHDDIKAALRRFLDWHQANPRRVAGTEVRMEAEVTVGGELVKLYGFADRIEVDAEGQVVVVDLKTMKRPPTNEHVTEHAQLALYQLAVAHGAVDHLAGEGARPGGAELVQLRGDKPAAGAKVQHQPAPVPGDDGRLPVELKVAEVVRRIRDEEFPVREGDHCKHCSFEAMCPLKTSGTVLT